MWDIEGTGIDRGDLERLIEEQIYTLPGTDHHREEFSIVLTGSRAMGTHAQESDVDLDVLCPRDTFEAVHRACLEKGLISTPNSFFGCLPEDAAQSYFGKERGYQYYSFLPLEDIERQFREYDDVAIWVWTNTRIITDPSGRFQRLRDSFRGYPSDVLIRKTKYYWLLAWYWAIEVYPHHHTDDRQLLPAGTAVLNTVNTLLKFFFIAEGRPFPYDEQLIQMAGETELGRRFVPELRKAVDLVIGNSEPDLCPWERLDKAFDLVACEEDGGFYEACVQAMTAAGVEQTWIEADFNNIHELLCGNLGPTP